MSGVDIYQIGHDIHYFLHQSGIVGEYHRDVSVTNRLLIRCGVNGKIDQLKTAQIDVISRCFDRIMTVSNPRDFLDSHLIISIDDIQKDQDHDDITYGE